DLYPCLSGPTFGFQRMVVVLSGLGNRPIRDRPKDIFHRKVRSVFIGSLWGDGLAYRDRSALSLGCTFPRGHFILRPWGRVLYPGDPFLCRQENPLQPFYLAPLCLGRRHLPLVANLWAIGMMVNGSSS